MASRSDIKAKETRYAGCRFRSRLEARWAVFFDRLGVRWHYEFEGFDLSDGTSYLPDFWLPRPEGRGWWAEVKPGPFSEESLEKCVLLASESEHSVLLLDGPPEWRSYFFASTHMEEACDVIFVGSPHDHDPAQGWFYTGSGADWPHPWIAAEEYGRDYYPEPAAYIAARSARFEFGESGAP